MGEIKEIKFNHESSEENKFIQTDTNQIVKRSGSEYDYREVIQIGDKYYGKKYTISIDDMTTEEILKELDPFGYTVEEAANYPLLLVEAIGENMLDDLFEIDTNSLEDAINIIKNI